MRDCEINRNTHTHTHTRNKYPHCREKLCQFACRQTGVLSHPTHHPPQSSLRTTNRTHIGFRWHCWKPRPPVWTASSCCFCSICRSRSFWARISFSRCRMTLSGRSSLHRAGWRDFFEQRGSRVHRSAMGMSRNSASAPALIALLLLVRSVRLLTANVWPAASAPLSPSPLPL